MHYVYVLKSEKDHELSVGYSEDLQERVRAHNAGEVPATRPRRPLRLVFYEAYGAKSDAKRREQYLKTSKGSATLRLMLRDTLQG